MKNTSVPGADGWKVEEMQALPLQLYEKLAEVLNLVGETGKWPVPLTRGSVSLILKGEGSAPQKPKKCTSTEKWADTALYSCSPGKRAEDVWMVLSLSVESALADGSDLIRIVDRLVQMF